MASKEEVEKGLHRLIERLGGNDDAARALGRSLPERRILSLQVTDLDEGYWTELSEGRLGPLQPGDAADAHIRISATSEDLVELIDGGGSVFSAYLSGRIRIEASFSDLLKLRKLA